MDQVTLTRFQIVYYRGKVLKNYQLLYCFQVRCKLVVWTVVVSILFREEISNLGDSWHTALGGLREEGGGAQCRQLS